MTAICASVPIVMQELKDTRIVVMVTRKEHKRLRRAAFNEGLTLSEVARELLLGRFNRAKNDNGNDEEGADQ
jgi:hypothetical protein